MKKPKKKASNDNDDIVYVHRFEITTDMPWLTEESVKDGLYETSEGYEFRVEELPIFKKRR